jgi:hypothetical protein
MRDARKPYYFAVIMRNAPRIDDITALALLELHQAAPLGVLAYWDEMKCEDSMIEMWEKGGWKQGDKLMPPAYAINVGNRKYNLPTNENKVGSATEFVARHLNIDLPYQEQVVKLLNENNRTGMLKGSFMSVAWMVLELYSHDFWTSRVMAHAKDVSKKFILSLDPANHKREWDLEAAKRELGNIVDKACKSDAPFSVGGYLRHLWILGHSFDHIRRRVSYWVEIWDLLKNYQRETEEGFMAGMIKIHEFVIAGCRGIAMESDRKMEVKVASRHCALLINKDPKTGRVAILSPDLRLDLLAAKLKVLEEGLWYHQKGTGIINGGLHYGSTPPTRFSTTQLVRFATELVRPPAR